MVLGNPWLDMMMFNARANHGNSDTGSLNREYINQWIEIMLHIGIDIYMGLHRPSNCSALMVDLFLSSIWKSCLAANFCISFIQSIRCGCVLSISHAKISAVNLHHFEYCCFCCCIAISLCHRIENRFSLH